MHKLFLFSTEKKEMARRHHDNGLGMNFFHRWFRVSGCHVQMAEMATGKIREQGGGISSNNKKRQFRNYF